MAGSEAPVTRFVVQWEEHPSHLASRLGQLLEQQTLVDVTLMCNTHTLRVHRSVLAACSPYFENLLQNISQRQLVQHPLIVLKDMQFTVLKCMIEFMYCGETNVTEDDLGPLLQAAKFFQVKGLSSMTKEALGLPSRPSGTPAKGKVNGEVGKAMAVKPTAPVTPRAGATHKTMVMAMPSKSTPKTMAVRESPGLGSTSSESAELLLSLSGDGKEAGQTKVVSQQMKMSTKQLQLGQRPVQVGTTSARVGAAADSTFQLAPNQPDGGSPLYTPGPRKRGRPLKRQMDLMFQEKVMSDTDMALRKEAEASRKALQNLQKDMLVGGSSDSSDTTTTTPTTPTRVVKTASSQPQQNLQMRSKLVPATTAASKTTPVASAPAAKKAETAAAAVPATTTTTSTEEGTITYQLADTSGGGQSVMSQYMEVLKEAGLPTDVPILLDSGDGNYVTVNEEILMNIVNGGGLQYQVTEEQQEVGAEGAAVSATTAEGTEGQVLTLDGGEGMQQQQLVRYVDDNGEIVEGVLAVVQEGEEEGTTVAVTPSGQVLQLQSSGDGQGFQLVEASAEGLISGDLEPQQDAAGQEGDAAAGTKRDHQEDSDTPAVKKQKMEGDLAL